MHKSFGAVILILIVMRFIWRSINVSPKANDPENITQKMLANIMHRGLYILMLAQPLAGIIMSQAAGYPVSFFGLFEFPVFLEKSKMLAEVARNAHGTIWVILALAVFGHVAASLYHHFIKKDDTLKRMTTGV
jgi:cytochrome b561